MKIFQIGQITEKVSFNIASEVGYVYILSGQKLIKNAKNGPFWRVFENLKLKIQMRHFEWFSNMKWWKLIRKLGTVIWSSAFARAQISNGRFYGVYVAAHYIIHVNVQQQPKLLVMNEPQTSSEKAVKGERNCKLFYCHFCTRRKSSSFKTHGVWKSQEKSHSTLRAKRATFTFY